MGWIDSWQHFTPSILLQGRLTHKEGKPLEGEEEVEPEELLRREVKKDPWEPRLKPISRDKKIKGGMPAWVLRTYNSSEMYIDAKTGKSSQNYGTVVVKSMWWPGAFSFYNGDRMLSIYVGDGQKHEQQTYYPVHPPKMMEERPEVECWGEPNPTEEYLAYIASKQPVQFLGGEGED